MRLTQRWLPCPAEPPPWRAVCNRRERHDRFGMHPGGSRASSASDPDSQCPMPKASADAGSGPDDRGGRHNRRADGVLAIGSLVIDLKQGTASRAGVALTLLPRQFAVLVCLATHANQVVGRETIAREVWGDQTAMWTNVITVNINGLRKQLEGDGLPVLLHTIRGRGYLLGELPG